MVGENVRLHTELTQRLNEISARKRIVRDAFFNRVFLLLAAAPNVVDTLLFSDVGKSWRTEVWSEFKHEGPFFQNGFYPLEPSIDPFWAVRTGMEMFATDAGLDDYVEPTTGKTDSTVATAPHRIAPGTPAMARPMPMKMPTVNEVMT